MVIRWTEEEAIARGFKKDKNGNWSLLRSPDPRQVPKPKPSPSKLVKKADGDKEKRKDKGEKGNSDCFVIEVISRRCRHCDPDNLCPKWYIDELVRAKVIPDDSSKYIIRFVKKVRLVKTKEEEQTIIRIYKVIKEL